MVLNCRLSQDILKVGEAVGYNIESALIEAELRSDLSAGVSYHER